jgi:hypothetical protein
MKYRRNAARLRFIVRPNTYYGDSKIVPIPDESNAGEVMPSVHIELANVGTYPTTILNIWSEQKLDGGWSMGNSGTIFVPHSGKVLPYMIGVGDIWSCRADQAGLLTRPGKMPLQIFVAVSHLDKPLVKDVVFTRGEQS